jgi:hypothetical protein
MSELLAIGELTPATIVAEIQFVTLARLDADHLATFLARVDWSGDEPDETVAELIGQVEVLASEYADGDLTEDEYRSALLALVVSPTATNATFETLPRVILNGSPSRSGFVDTPRQMVTA